MYSLIRFDPFGIWNNAPIFDYEQSLSLQAFEDLGKAGSHTARSSFLRSCKISDLIAADFFNLENWRFSHEPGNNFTEI
jgi:hypothetical protein